MKNFVLPKKIIFSEGEFKNLNSLLHCQIDQSSFAFDDGFELNGGGTIVLDFGKELSGGLRITNRGSNAGHNLIHITFGESVSEVMTKVGEFNSTNDHSPREFDYLLPDFSTIEVGNTGFRFVKIDFPRDINQRIYSINAIEHLLDDKMFGEFESSDEELNKIFEVASRTATLCVQNYILDGIKRDRLVWSGDLFQEIKSIFYLYGNIKEIEKTLLFIEETNKMPCYIQGMPTYSLWYIACLNEYFKFVGKCKFLEERSKYVEDILNLINKAVNKDGLLIYDDSINYALPYFIDWRTAEIQNAKLAAPSFYLYFLNESKELFKYLKLNEMTRCIVDKLTKFTPKFLNVSQFDCFALLNDKIDHRLVLDSISKTRETQLSTFSNYFVFKSIFDYDKDLSLSMFKNYHMAMIDLDATTFFEEFEYSWKDSIKINEMPNGKFDMYRDVGLSCYKGLRKSLCHGWASGPVSFIFENIVGFKGVQNNKIIFKPYLNGLKNFKAKFLCSLGVVEVEYKNNNFIVKTPKNTEFEILK